MKALKRIKKALNTSEGVYRTIFESVGTALIIFDDEMRIKLVNSVAEKLLGYSKEEIEGRMRWTDFVQHEDLLKRYPSQKSKEGKPLNYTLKLVERYKNIRCWCLHGACSKKQ
ncbi:MAG: PAS domain S-box protein [Candidatus Methanomethylicaceae archaeon]